MLTYTNIRLTLVILIALGVGSSALDLYLLSRTPERITILTLPIEKLEHHEHDTSRGDSLDSEGHIESVLSEKVVLEHDIWITGMEIVSKNAPQAVIHHMHLFAPEKKDAYCSVMPEMLMDIGQDAIPFGDFPKGYGIFLPKGTTIQVNAALHNPDPPLGTGEDYADVSVGFTLRIDRYGSLKGLKHLSLHIVSLADREHCNATTFTVPPQTKHYQKQSKKTDGSTITMNRPGTIVAIGAHIHAWEGGEHLRAYQNDTLLHEFLPTKMSTEPEVWQTSPVFTSFRVEKGDVLTLSSQYSNPFTVPVTGAMGMTAFFIHYDE